MYNAYRCTILFLAHLMSTMKMNKNEYTVYREDRHTLLLTTWKYGVGFVKHF
jgi:hypothetical protein